MTDSTALTWDELDQLADWTAGALAGPAAERIATLVRADPRWAAAYTALTAAETPVRSALRAAAQTTSGQRMPAEVATRLDAALADAARAHVVTTHSSAVARSFPAQLTHPRPTGPGAGRPPSRPAARRSRRTVVAGLSVLLLFVGGFWGVTLVGQGVLPSAGRANAPEAIPDNDQEGVSATWPPIAPGASTAGVADPFRMIASGTDYQRDTLAQLATEQRDGPALAPGYYSDELRELAMEQQLDGCLTAVLSLRPGTVVLVDFATFEGQPAVIVVVRAGTSVTVFAVGPECGPGDADLLTTPIAS